MSNTDPIKSAQESAPARAPRRALIVAEKPQIALQDQLPAVRYALQTTTAADAERAITQFAPDVVIMVVAPATGEIENENVKLARKLRTETATYSLPIVFAWVEDDRALRAASQYIGVDDYFALDTQSADLTARLESLFWRVETGRRATAVAGDRRLEIDNFMFMLDEVREDMRAGTNGTLALIYAVGRRGHEHELDKSARDRTLADTHSFLKLNLRRIDAVVFYGPTTLLVYLPRMETGSAVAALSRLRRELFDTHPQTNIVAGLASFPMHGREVEGLIEKAEEAARDARSLTPARNILPYEAKVRPAATNAAQASEVDQQPSDDRAAPAATEAAAMTEAPAKVPEEHIEASGDQDEATRALVEQAAARERERRASGAIMPRRLLLTVSDAARMTHINSLIRAAGYEARTAFNGQQALDLLRIERPDLLLLDYELQGINGVETIRRLRKQSGSRPLLPVIMLLSNANEQARDEALELGARNVLTAPYDPAELLASLRHAGSVE